ncbi:acyl carrier protein [Kitasatospora sp. NPDC057940]|uniref:acyl carrier protein n=1 Tax=unclassified Kitasatospora TaxID=2633591 RepID=UPI002F91787D|nr:acyl carrier protein [Kitasatospora sp. NBC_01300]
MTTDFAMLARVRHIIALLAERPDDEIGPEDRLFEDLSLDSLQITELAERLEQETGAPVDEEQLNAAGTTVARCAEIVAGA